MLDGTKKAPVTPLKSKKVVGIDNVDNAPPRPRAYPPPHREPSQTARSLLRDKPSSLQQSPVHPRVIAVYTQNLISPPTASTPTVASKPSKMLSYPRAFVSASYRAQGNIGAQQSGFIGYSPPEMINTPPTSTSSSRLLSSSSTEATQAQPRSFVFLSDRAAYCNHSCYHQIVPTPHLRCRCAHLTAKTKEVRPFGLRATSFPAHHSM